MHEAVQLLLRDVVDEGVAIPFATLVLRLRQRGAAVTEGVLERRLRAGDSGVRVLDPWQGPQAALRRMIASAEGDGLAGLWIVPGEGREAGSEPDGSGPGALSRALRRLGMGLDERSPRDVARWIALVEEADQLRRKAA